MTTLKRIPKDTSEIHLTTVSFILTDEGVFSRITVEGAATDRLYCCDNLPNEISIHSAPRRAAQQPVEGKLSLWRSTFLLSTIKCQDQIFVNESPYAGIKSPAGTDRP